MFPDGAFERQDDRPDETFYQQPRKVVHIDDSAIAAVRRIFAEQLPSGGTYLDLMSSWRTHLPDTLDPARVVGLGMNAAEMQDNPQLDEIVVHNLNETPTLPFDDDSFDAVMCTVSVQYLTQPVEVFQQVRRVLRPDGPFIVTFSNRCFPSKAVAIWLSMGDEGHIQLVRSYFEAAGGWEQITVERHTAPRGFFGGPDPLYGVWARALV